MIWTIRSIVARESNARDDDDDNGGDDDGNGGDDDGNGGDDDGNGGDDDGNGGDDIPGWPRRSARTYVCRSGRAVGGRTWLQTGSPLESRRSAYTAPLLPVHVFRGIDRFVS